MIQIRNLTKQFGERILFHNFDLEINDGEFVVFSGPSGCGKTTLLNIIGGIEPVDDGSIIVNGINVHDRKEQLKYYREVVGFLFQNFALVENKTVEDNLKIVRKKSRNNLSFQEALEMVGMADKLKAKVYTLSGGEQQRVALARLLIKKSSLILADEPTGSLDDKNADAVISILKEMNKQGKTIILVTHDEKIKKMVEKVIKL